MTADPSFVLGVDSSTQSTKVEVRDRVTGDLLATGRAPHPPTTPPRSEQDPEAWWHALGVALAGVADHLPHVAAISVAGQQHGLVVLDDAGSPLRPAKLWNDTESAPQASRLVATLGADTWAATIGSVPVASFTITKLAWLHDTEPEVARRVAAVMLPHDYLTWRLTGAHVTDRGDASGSGWWATPTGTHRPDLIELAGGPPDLAVPRVLGPLEAAGTLRTAPGDLPFAPGTVVAPGTGDNMAGALGIGLGPGDVAVSLGTSGTVYAVADHPTADPSGAVAGFADATGRFLPLVCTLNATKVTDWMASMLGLDPAGLATAALTAPPGSGGVVVVPYFDGERTPNRPEATGSVHGLRTTTSAAQLARAAHEGVVCGLLDGVDALRAAGVRLDGRLALVGGGARSAAFRTIVAGLSDLPVVVPAADEAVATGAAVQAAAVFEGVDPLEVARRWGLRDAEPVEGAVGAVDAAAVRAAYRAAAADPD